MSSCMLALNFASTHQTENPRGFSEVDENKKLPTTIVVLSIILTICLIVVSVFQNRHTLSFLHHYSIP